ncbi:unnamed protein product [Mesocestoides corti]|uniref:TIMELESS-interacting protein n=1 Tax=Mesocestoides corti TaxID=53468 RepID=A0A3P6GQD0_MESCO|nr:unnamed protein product [Mesocestoides corti]
MDELADFPPGEAPPLLPSEPILSSTRIGERPASLGGARRRRLRRVDSDDEGEGVTSSDYAVAAPFPNFTSMSSPIARNFPERGSSPDADPYKDYSAGEGDSDDSGAVRSDADDRQVNSDGEHGGEHPERPVDAGVDDVDVEVLNRLKRLAKGAAKTVKRPLPKLDPPTLLGERGLPALVKELERVQFKGRGYEFEDLEKLMFVYESWAHRMLPKFLFNDVLERLEAVGSKREVHSVLQRMRAGTWPPILSSEFVHESDDCDSNGETEPKASRPPFCAFRFLSVIDDVHPPVDLDQEMVELTQPDHEDDKKFVALPTPESPPRPSTSTAVTQHANEESLEDRIERNRLLALERLEARRRLSSQQTTSNISSSGERTVFRYFSVG